MAVCIYVICDNSPYYRSKAVQDYLKASHIQFVFLPPYAPNLSLIERLWQFFKKRVLYSIIGIMKRLSNFEQRVKHFMALSHSGHRLNGGLQNSRAFPGIRFIYTSKNVNSDFIIKRKISMIKYSLC